MWVYIAMLLCAGLLGVLVYRYDLYDREPLGMVLLALGTGAGLMHGAGAVEDLLLPRFELLTNHAAKAMLVALVEDGAKLAGVMGIAWLLPRWFNDPLDGVIYGTLVGLGAGIDESALYLSFASASVQSVAVQLPRLVAHALMGGVVGFSVGLGARPGGRLRWRPAMIAAGLLASMIIHFSWDWIAYRAGARAWAHGAVMGLMLVLMATWGLLVVRATRWSCVVFSTGSAIRMPNPTTQCH